MAAKPGAMSLQDTQDYFFELPNEILYMIFANLTLRDLGRCMRLCKRCKTVLETQEFWKNYLKIKYNFAQVKGGARQRINLDRLINNWYCYWDDSCEKPGANDPARYIFRPFPKMLAKGIITPADFEPFPQDVNYDYKALNKALHLSLKLRKKCNKFQITSSPFSSNMMAVPNVCLFPWPQTCLPKPKDVLMVFNTHKQISERIENIHVAEKLSYVTGFRPNYMDNNINLDFCVDSLNNTFSRIKKNNKHEKELFQWLQKLFQPSLMFTCGIHAIEPQLYFHLTILSPGWVGGIFTLIRVFR